jgi:Domain of unknown function (DUF4190)
MAGYTHRMQSPPLGAPWIANGTTKTNGTSVFALVASISGFTCFMGIGGALGIALGLIARSEITRSEGRETGRGLATAAIVVGVLNISVTVIGLAVAITFLARPTPSSASRSAPAVTAPSYKPPAPSLAPRAPRTAPRPPAARASREQGSQVTTLGAITLADIAGDFADEVDKQRRAAASEDEVLVLWLVVPNCKPCAGVAAALTSPAAQKALAKVRFVRVDRDEFQVELERLGIPTEKIPGFVLLDAHNHPRDFIHGGEWDADIAANIAPVLGKFAHGSYPKRRHPWHGPARDDETTL